MSGSAGGGSGGSSCLSVFGLAYDATEREVHVLFSGCEGYIRCIVVPGKGSQKPYAFVQFEAQQDALFAMEGRQGTTWEEGAQPVAIELAKRDIPHKFVPRQQQWAAPRAEVASALPPARAAPGPPKRPRQETTLAVASPAATANTEAAVGGGGGGPRTLHLGGLPAALTQDTLDFFLSSNFGSHCLGGKLSDGGHGARTGRAFVGFLTHHDAREAQAMLEGFNWEGAVLRAEWARTEYRPPPPGDWQSSAVAPARAAAPARSLRSQAAVQSEADWRASAQAEDWGPARCTLHFTNLPGVDEQEFNSFIRERFPDQITFAHFKDTRDRRPPVAWVLFEAEELAVAALASHQTFEWHNTHVLVQYARTELDPNRFRGR